MHYLCFCWVREISFHPPWLPRKNLFYALFFKKTKGWAVHSWKRYVSWVPNVVDSSGSLRWRCESQYNLTNKVLPSATRQILVSLFLWNHVNPSRTWLWNVKRVTILRLWGLGKIPRYPDTNLVLLLFLKLLEIVIKPRPWSLVLKLRLKQSVN